MQRVPADPGGRPPNRLFVPDAVKMQVLQWGHASKLSCHPGIHRTFEFLRQKFWWRQCGRISGSLWRCVQSVPAVKPAICHQLACSNLCLLPAGHSPTLQWTSSPDSHCLKVTPLSFLWWTGFQMLYILSPSPNCLPLQRPPDS